MSAISATIRVICAATAQRVFPGLVHAGTDPLTRRDPPQGHSEDRATQITSSGVVEVIYTV
jgi:hypothetical protein